MACSRKFCEPLKMWNPMNSKGSVPRVSSIAGTHSASTPKGLGPLPIFMPADLSSKSGLMRIATRGRMGFPSASAAIRSISALDSMLMITPLSTAACRSASDFPGPAKLMLAGLAPASRATLSSPAEATSNPSVIPARYRTTSGMGLAFIA